MDNKKIQTGAGRLALMVLLASAAIYVLIFYGVCCMKYYGFIYDDFDLAIHDQIIWNILHGRIYNSILGTDFLGNHANFISFLVAPFYFLASHPLFLLFLQTGFLAAGVIPLYALARRYLDSRVSVMIGIVYLLYPGLEYTNLFEFHPTCFAVFFLLCAAYYFYTENFPRFNVFMVLSMICQENVPLIFIMWGFYAFLLRREWKWVLWPAALGAAYFLFCVYVVLPAFNKSTFNFFQIYGPLGHSFGQVLATCLSHPVKVAAIIFQPGKLYYLLQLFISVSFLPLYSPLALLPSLLIFIQHLLSFRPSEVSLHYHYTAELIPFIFVALVMGARKMTASGLRPAVLGGILIFNALICNLIFGPHLHLAQEWKRLAHDRTIAQKERLVSMIPDEAPVVTTFEFLSHLDHRESLYSFHHVYSGFFTLFTKKYVLPDNVQYALIDFNDYLTFFGFYGHDNYRNTVEFLKQGSWGVVDVKDTIVLLKKGFKDRYPLFRAAGSPFTAVQPGRWIIDRRMELTGYDARMQGDCLYVIFCWKLLRPEQKDVNLFIDLVDKDGKLIDRKFRPICYRIWPTQAWIRGLYIEEHQYISLSPQEKGRLNALKVGFYDFATGNLVATDSGAPLGQIELKIAG